MRKVALYCRVSTDNQEKAETIDNQLRDLNKVYSPDEIVKVYKDNPGSGADPDRVGLTEMRRDAQKHLFEVIGLWASDRLARDVKLSLILRDEFKELGIKIEVMGKEREDDSDLGKIMGIIEATMDEIERGRIKRRFTSGKNRRLSEGKLIGSYPPYGYKHIRRDREKGTDASFEINETEAAVVRKIFSLYLKYESMLMVAVQLQKEGIKSRGKGRSEPGLFQTSMVRKVLMRETYIGNQYHGKSSPCLAKFHIHKIRKYRFTGRRANPKDTWKVIKVPRIIDDEVFYRVQDILKHRAKHPIEMSKYEFLCQGFVRCAVCGRSYGGRIQNGSLLYRCPQAFTSNMNQPPCKSRSMSARKLDAAVWAFLSSLINDKDRIKNALLDLRVKKEKDKVSNKDSYDHLFVEKTILKNKRKNLFDLYSEEGISAYSKSDLKSKLSELDEKEMLLDRQMAELKNQMEQIKNDGVLEKEIEETRRLYRKKMDNPPFELRKYIARKWIEEVNILDDGSLRIKARIPDKEEAVGHNNNTYEFFASVNMIHKLDIRFEEIVNFN